MNQEWDNLSGTEWPDMVGKVWESARSRFGTEWDELSHHDQVSIYRLLLSLREDLAAAWESGHRTCRLDPDSLPFNPYRRPAQGINELE